MLTRRDRDPLRESSPRDPTTRPQRAGPVAMRQARQARQAAPRAQSGRSSRAARASAPRAARHYLLGPLAGAASPPVVAPCRRNCPTPEHPRRAPRRPRHAGHDACRGVLGVARCARSDRPVIRHLRGQGSSGAQWRPALRASGRPPARRCARAAGRGLFDHDRDRDSGRGGHDHAGLHRPAAADGGDRAGHDPVGAQIGCCGPNVRGAGPMRRRPLRARPPQ
jgi:hypothetical protein